MARTELLPDFKDLLSALADSSAEYLVVGGWAVGFHSEPRFTKDLDLLIGQDEANLKRVVAALTRFGAPPEILEDLRALGPEEFLFLGVPPARVDLLRTVPGVEFEMSGFSSACAGDELDGRARPTAALRRSAAGAEVATVS